MTEPQALKLVAVLLAGFPTTKASPETVQVYARMLADLEYVVANAAVERLTATSKWFPAVAEVREACMALAVGEPAAGGDAWGAVLAAIRHWGAYRTPGKDFEFPDPLVLHCVRSLGWQELCRSENQVADRARFVELYDQLAASHRTRALADDLPALKRLRAAQPGLSAGRADRQVRDPRTRLAGSLGDVLRQIAERSQEADRAESEGGPDLDGESGEPDDRGRS